MKKFNNSHKKFGTPAERKAMKNLKEIRRKFLVIAHEIGGEDGRQLAEYANAIQYDNCYHYSKGIHLMELAISWDLVHRYNLEKRLTKQGWHCYDREYFLGCRIFA